jgi:hypothetical protein
MDSPGGPARLAKSPIASGFFDSNLFRVADAEGAEIDAFLFALAAHRILW